MYFLPVFAHQKNSVKEFFVMKRKKANACFVCVHIIRLSGMKENSSYYFASACFFSFFSYAKKRTLKKLLQLFCSFPRTCFGLRNSKCYKTFFKFPTCQL